MHTTVDYHNLPLVVHFYGEMLMANIRLGEDKKEIVPLRLPIWMINQIKEKGKTQDVIETILSQHFKKEKNNQNSN